MSELLSEGIPYNIEKSQNMKTFWDGLNNNKLMTTQCDKCDSIHFPPTPQLCRNCFGIKMRWIELPLEGTITTWTEVTAPPDGFTNTYQLVSVNIDKLDKSILGRMVEGIPKIGDRVKVNFEKVGDQSILVFKKL